MSGPNPVIPTHRIQMELVTEGFVHKIRSFLGLTASGDVTGYNTVARAGFSPVGVSVAIDAYWTVLAPIYNSVNTAFGVTHVQQFVGGSWIDLSIYNTVVAPTSSGGAAIAWGLVYSMKDTLNRRGPVELLETDTATALKRITRASLGTPLRNILDFYMGTGSTIPNESGYCWRQSRSGVYFSTFLSVVSDTNEKMRRKRGLK